MEGFQSSRIEKKKATAMSTGFEFTCEDDTASELDLCLGDEVDLEQDYIGKLKTQRERVFFKIKLDVKVIKVLPIKIATVIKISNPNKRTPLRN